METELDLIKIGAHRLFTDVFATSARVDIFHLAAQEIHEMIVSGKVYGERNMKEYEIKHPSDWWQAVKEHFAPEWFLLRFPVKYTTHHISVDAVYPELSKRLKLPTEAHHLILSHWSE